MDLTWSDEEEAFRLEARAWLEQNLAEWHDEVGGHPESGDTSEGFAQHLLWERRLFADRWAVVSWAPEHGGRGASLWEWLLFEEEYYRAGGPQRITQNGIFLLAPSIYEFGTAEQRDGILPRMAGAEDLWCQGWSEPNAGSDLASVSSRARSRSTAAGCSTARRPGPPGARSAPTSSGCSAPTRSPSATRASPTCSSRSTRRA